MNPSGTRSLRPRLARTSLARVPVKFKTSDTKHSTKEDTTGDPTDNSHKPIDSTRGSKTSDIKPGPSSNSEYQDLLRRCDKGSDRVKKHLTASQSGRLIRASPSPPPPTKRKTKTSDTKHSNKEDTTGDPTDNSNQPIASTSKGPRTARKESVHRRKRANAPSRAPPSTAKKPKREPTPTPAIDSSDDDVPLAFIKVQWETETDGNNNKAKAKRRQGKKGPKKVRRETRRLTREFRRQLMETGGSDTLEALPEDSDMDMEDSGSEMVSASASELDVGPSTSCTQSSTEPPTAGFKWFKEFMQELFIPVADFADKCLQFVSKDLPIDTDTDAMDWPSGNAAGVQAMEEQLNQESTNGLAEMESAVTEGETVRVKARTRNPPRPRLTQAHATRNTISEMLDAGIKPAKIAYQLNVSGKLVYTVKKLKMNGEDLAPKYGGGRPTTRTPQMLEMVKATYKKDPMVPYPTTGRKLGVSATTISRAVRDLGMKSYVIRFRALISGKTKAVRVDRSEQLLEWLKAHPDTVVIFSDKKIFTVISDVIILSFLS